MNEAQLEFLQVASVKGQNGAILAALRAEAGQWVSMTTLGAIAGCWAVHSRCADLRKLGYRIENRRERRDGKVHSFYRLA